MANFTSERKWLCIVAVACVVVCLLPKCVSAYVNDIQEKNEESFPLKVYSPDNLSAVIKPVGVPLGKAEFIPGPHDNITLELLIFCDMNFSALFNFEEDLIREYLHVYLYDVYLRFQTISSAYISILISDIIIITNAQNQPFIEVARSSSGYVSLDKALLLFSEYTFSKMTSHAKFDVTVTFLNSAHYPSKMFEIAARGGACQAHPKEGRYLGSAIVIDDGTFHVNRGARALAHLIGAHYDADIPLGCPSTGGGYIMGDKFNLQLRYLFSSCSSRSIGYFVRSGGADCLRRIDNEGSYFAKSKAPTKIEQYNRSIKIENAFVSTSETAMSTCTHIDCYWIDSYGSRSRRIFPVDNTPCSNSGYCFRGRCLSESFLIKNTGSNMCMQTYNRLSSRDGLHMVKCPLKTFVMPTQKFSLKPTNGGYTISTPHAIVTDERTENSDKCFIAHKIEGTYLHLFKCESGENPNEIWDLEYVDYGRAFLLRHRNTTKCAKQSGQSVVTTFVCDSTNPFMIWKIATDEE